jgi:hypothetical protein
MQKFKPGDIIQLKLDTFKVEILGIGKTLWKGEGVVNVYHVRIINGLLYGADINKEGDRENLLIDMVDQNYDLIQDSGEEVL